MARISNALIYHIFSIFFLFLLAVESNSDISSGILLKLDAENVSSTNVTNPKTENVTNETTIVNSTTHKGREGVSLLVPKATKPNNISEKIEMKSHNITTTHLNATSKPTVAVLNATKTISNTQKATTKIMTKPKKPEKTEHDEIELPTSKPDVFSPSLVHIDTNMDKKVRRADYVVPIVAVILSVPLVAIIISVLYKRGKDWWQHRNYRRMDFLIEGMYNS